MGLCIYAWFGILIGSQCADELGRVCRLVNKQGSLQVKGSKAIDGHHSFGPWRTSTRRCYYL